MSVAKTASNRPAPIRTMCFTEEQERLYQRGWPYLRILVDGHRDDNKPAAAAQKYNRYHVHWPREVAHRFVRAALHPSVGAWASPEVQERLGQGGAVNEDEAGVLLDDLMYRRDRVHPHRLSSALLLVEAMVGAEFVVDTILRRIECLPRARWLPQRSPFNTGDDEIPAFLAFHLGFMMLRLPGFRALEVRDRLYSLYDRMVDVHAIPRHERSLLGAIDLALNGATAAKRVLPGSRWKYLIWYSFVDNLTMIKKRMDKVEGKHLADWVPNGRLVFLAGFELLDVYLENLHRVTSHTTPGFLEDMGMFRHEKIVPIMLSFLGKKAAREVPLSWFRRHAEFAWPELERLAKQKSPLSRAAQAALEALSP